MIYRILWLIVLAGTMCRCGGSAFTSSDPPSAPTPDAPAPALDGGAEIAVIVAGPEAAAVPPDAATDAAPTPDAAQVPESRAPAPDACPAVPPAYAVLPPYCPPTCHPEDCSTQDVPQYYFFASPGRCVGLATPSECQTCGNYSCACLLGKMDAGCSCNEDTGVVTVVCP